MKQAHLVEQTPTRAGRKFWYILTATATSEKAGTRLQTETARYVARHLGRVDPASKEAALAHLHAWAERNGWTIVGEGSAG